MINITEVSVGDVIILSDEDSLMESMKQGLGPVPHQFIVKDYTVIKQFDNMVEWAIINITEEKVLLVRSVGDIQDVYVLKTAELPVGNRKTFIENDMLWLFQEPKDVNNFSYSELKYSMDIKETKDNGEEVLYIMKSQGELSGKAYIGSSIHKNMLGTVVEYSTTDGKQAVIVEVGDINNEDGGLITLYTGKIIPTKDVDLLNNKNII